ncbi:MAG: hypothetical protein WBG43_02700 [Marinifilaceae bacterium]
MKKLSLTILLISVFIFSGCEKEKDNFVPDAICDVYVKAIKDEGKTKYALFARTFANFGIKSASVKTPDNKIKELTKRNNIPNIFDYYKDNIEAYSEVVPTKGNYTFTVTTNDDINISRVNQLNENIADFPVISSCKITDNSLNVTWDENEDTDFYILNLYAQDKTLIFSNEFIKNSQTININNNSKGWYTDKKLADAFSVKLMAAKFDNKLKPSLYLIQSITETSKNIE